MRIWTLFRGLLRRDLSEMRSYAFNTATQTLVIFMIFVFIFYGARAALGGRPGAGETLSAIVVGFMVWTQAISTYSDIAFAVVGEATAGTLEQVAMSPFGLTVVMLVRFVSNFLLSLAMVLVLLFLMMATTGKWLNLDLVSVLPLLFLVAVGVQGIGFMLGGAALVAKRVQSLLQVLQFAFVALVSISPENVPALKYLPITWGNHLIGRVMIDERSIVELGAGDLAFLVANSLGWLFLGIAVFRRMTDVARDRALLGQY